MSGWSYFENCHVVVGSITTGRPIEIPVHALDDAPVRNRAVVSVEFHEGLKNLCLRANRRPCAQYKHSAGYLPCAEFCHPETSVVRNRVAACSRERNGSARLCDREVGGRCGPAERNHCLPGWDWRSRDCR